MYLILLVSLGPFSPCGANKRLPLKTKVDERFTSFVYVATLAQRHATGWQQDSFFKAYDTAYYFTIIKNVPEQISNPAAAADALSRRELRFAVARKGFDLYLWRDRNFNGTFADDPYAFRKEFFRDSSQRWLRQQDPTIDYTFNVPPTNKRNIRLFLGLDIYMLLSPDRQSYSVDILFSSKNSYQLAPFRSGWKRYVAVTENSAVARFWGMCAGEVYFFPKRGLRKQQINYTKRS